MCISLICVPKCFSLCRVSVFISEHAFVLSGALDVESRSKKNAA